MKTFFLYGVVILIILSPLTITSAQVTTVDEPFNFIKTAFDNMNALNSYKIESTQDNFFEGVSEESFTESTIARVVTTQLSKNPNCGLIDLNIVVNADGIVYWGATFGPEITGDGYQKENKLLILNEQAYVRFDGRPQIFPEGWFKPQDESSLANLNFQELQNRIEVSLIFLYSFDEAIVMSINELSPQIVDGKAFRVFDIRWNMPVLIEQGLFIPVIPNDSINEQTAIATYAVNTRLTQQIWVGEDNFIHRIDSQLISNAMYKTTEEIQPYYEETTATTSYFDFNVPIEIIAPELGS